MQHMQFIKLDLMERVNRTLAEQPISDLRWLLQPEIPQKPAHYQPEPHPIDPRLERSFHQMTESVANQECRESLQRLWQTFAANTR